MENYYRLIILSSSYNNIPTNIETLIINEPIMLINDYLLELQSNTQISFDYLIFDDVSLINNFQKTNILHDDGFPVTNFFLQTSLENIFYCSSKRINEVITNITENLV